MLNQFKTLSVIIAMSFSISSCSPIFEKEDWGYMDEASARNMLDYKFISLDAMFNIEGEERCGSTFGCDGGGFEYQIFFSLPTTMSPQDWLSFMTIQATPNDTFTFEKKSEFHYSRARSAIRYIPSDDRYKFTTSDS